MKLDICVGSEKNNSRLASFINDKTKSELEAFSSQIQSVEVAVSDLNGPRGGIDKECKIVLTLPRKNPVILAVRSINIHTAFRTALKKVVKTLRRQLDKGLKSRHRPGARVALPKSPIDVA